MAKKKKEVEEQIIEQPVEEKTVEEMTVAEIKEKNAKELEAFKEEVSKINDEKSLNKLEESIIEEYNNLDAIIKERVLVEQAEYIPINGIPILADE